MKKSKILIPALTIASVGAVVTPMVALTSCKKGSSGPSYKEELTDEEMQTWCAAAMAAYNADLSQGGGKIYNNVSMSGSWTDTQASKTWTVTGGATISYNHTGFETMAFVSFKYKCGTETDTDGSVFGGLPYDKSIGSYPFDLKDLLTGFAEAVKEKTGTDAKTTYYLGSDESLRCIITDTTAAKTKWMDVIIGSDAHMRKCWVNLRSPIGSTGFFIPVCNYSFSYSK